MRLKFFTAANMRTAMSEVRAVLGEDAIIVSTQNDEKGGVRITAAVESTDDFDAATYVTADNDTGFVGDPLPVMRQALHQSGADDDMIGTLLGCAHSALANRAGLGPVMALAASLDQCFRFEPLPEGGTGMPLMLVGPPGGGKTSLAAKLAAQARLKGSSVRVISTDSVRAGGIEQLRAYTSALRLGLRTAEGPEELKAAVAGCSGGDMVVIDTTGASPFDAQEMGALDQLRRSAEIEPLLVLAAGGDAIDSISIAEGFVALGCRRMIATRLDLSHRLGTLLTMAEATGLAFAGVSDTPRIAEGVSPVNPVSLARLILPIREAPAQLLTGTNA